MASEVADNEFARRFCPEPSDIRIGGMECETFAGASNPQSQGHPSNVVSPLLHEQINMLGRYSFSNAGREVERPDRVLAAPRHKVIQTGHNESTADRLLKISIGLLSLLRNIRPTD
jgi:hypothetical protein